MNFGGKYIKVIVKILIIILILTKLEEKFTRSTLFFPEIGLQLYVGMYVYIDIIKTKKQISLLADVCQGIYSLFFQHFYKFIIHTFFGYKIWRDAQRT